MEVDCERTSMEVRTVGAKTNLKLFYFYYSEICVSAGPSNPSYSRTMRQRAGSIYSWYLTEFTMIKLIVFICIYLLTLTLHYTVLQNSYISH